MHPPLQRPAQHQRPRLLLKFPDSIVFAINLSPDATDDNDDATTDDTTTASRPTAMPVAATTSTATLTRPTITTRMRKILPVSATIACLLL